MTDTPPARDERTLERRDGAAVTPARETEHGSDTDDEHEEQPGFPDGPTSPAEGGD